MNPQQENKIDSITIDRRMKIIEFLNSEGKVKVANLSQIFSVSEVTIRNDLSHLEKKGLLIRTRGGGLRSQRMGIDYKLNEKSKIHSEEKQRIGLKASEIINDDNTLILDSGTTTLEITKNLQKFKNLTVITNALNVASNLVDYDNIKTILLGGTLRNTSLSLTGSIAENSLKNFYCDKLFLGADGIDSEHGIFTHNPEEGHLNSLMVEVSKQVIVVTDSSKFKKRGFVQIAPISKIDIVITDSNIPDEEMKNLRSQGVEVIIA
jgi:DeoR family transcriptional regulator, aga operon transcriptional repressor